MSIDKINNKRFISVFLGTVTFASIGIALWIISTNVSYQAIGMSCCGIAGVIVLASLYRFYKRKKSQKEWELSLGPKLENVELLKILRGDMQLLERAQETRYFTYRRIQEEILDPASSKEIDQYLEATLREVQKAISGFEKNLPLSLYQKSYSEYFNSVHNIKLQGSKSDKIEAIRKLHAIFFCYTHINKLYLAKIVGLWISEKEIDPLLADWGQRGNFYEISVLLAPYPLMHKNALGLSPLESVLFGIYREKERYVPLPTGYLVFAGFERGFLLFSPEQTSREFAHFFEDRIALAKMLLEKMLKENNVVAGDPLFIKDLQDPNFIRVLREIISEKWETREKRREEILQNTKNHYLKCLLPILPQITRGSHLLNWLDYVEQMIPRLTPLYEVCASRQQEIQTLMESQNCFETGDLNRNISKLIIDYI